MTNEIKIGSNIRKIRKEEGLTQEKLAELSGLSINFIYRIERSNDQNISIKNLIMIAKALEVDAVDLLEAEKKEIKDNKSLISAKRLINSMSELDPDQANEVSSLFMGLLKQIKR
ncbi:helix-turn-helix transcriptional regulator [Oenococcus oeni]